MKSSNIHKDEHLKTADGFKDENLKANYYRKLYREGIIKRPKNPSLEKVLYIQGIKH